MPRSLYSIIKSLCPKSRINRSTLSLCIMLYYSCDSLMHPENRSFWLIEFARSSLKLCSLTLSLNTRRLGRRRIRSVESRVVSCITGKHFEDDGAVSLSIVTGRGSLSLIAACDMLFSSGQILSENSSFK